MANIFTPRGQESGGLGGGIGCLIFGLVWSGFIIWILFTGQAGPPTLTFFIVGGDFFAFWPGHCFRGSVGMLAVHKGKSNC